MDEYFGYQWRTKNILYQTWAGHFFRCHGYLCRKWWQILGVENRHDYGTRTSDAIGICSVGSGYCRTGQENIEWKRLIKNKMKEYASVIHEEWISYLVRSMEKACNVATKILFYLSEAGWGSFRFFSGSNYYVWLGDWSTGRTAEPRVMCLHRWNGPMVGKLRVTSNRYYLPKFNTTEWPSIIDPSKKEEESRAKTALAEQDPRNSTTFVNTQSIT